MSRSRLISLLLGLGCLVACDNRPVVNDGGDACGEELVTLRVEVMTTEGARVRGATVTATHLSTNQSITGVTNEQGISTAVNESLGPGSVRLHATAGAKVSPVTQVEWTCDDCHCTPEPGAVTLQLHP